MGELHRARCKCRTSTSPQSSPVTGLSRPHHENLPPGPPPIALRFFGTLERCDSDSGLAAAKPLIQPRSRGICAFVYRRSPLEGLTRRYFVPFPGAKDLFQRTGRDAKRRDATVRQVQHGPEVLSSDVRSSALSSQKELWMELPNPSHFLCEGSQAGAIEQPIVSGACGGVEATFRLILKQQTFDGTHWVSSWQLLFGPGKHVVFSFSKQTGVNRNPPERTFCRPRAAQPSPVNYPSRSSCAASTSPMEVKSRSSRLM